MSGRDSRSTILPQEGIEFKPPSDASRDGGTPHAVRVTMFSEFTGGYVKVRQGHEEPTSHNTRETVFGFCERRFDLSIHKTKGFQMSAASGDC